MSGRVQHKECLHHDIVPLIIITEELGDVLLQGSEGMEPSPRDFVRHMSYSSGLL